MTNNAAPIGLTFRGTDLQTDPIGLFFEIVGSPYGGMEVRGTDYLVPTSPGLFALNRIATRRILPIEGWVMGTGANEDAQRENFAVRRSLLMSQGGVFDPRLDPGALILTLEDGSQITADYRTLSDILWNQITPTLARVGVRVETVDPEWEAVAS